ncbi:nuclear transport factor 2 family protein [Actinocorallia aurantiaca]
MTGEEKPHVVRQMVDAWNATDREGIVSLSAPGGVLHGVTQEPLRGREAIRERLSPPAEGLVHPGLQIQAMDVVDGRVFLQCRDVFDAP